MNAHKKEITPTAFAVSDERTQTKRIGGTTYIVTSRFNGDTKRNPAFSFVRLVEREFAKM